MLEEIKKLLLRYRFPERKVFLNDFPPELREHLNRFSEHMAIPINDEDVRVYIIRHNSVLFPWNQLIIERPTPVKLSNNIFTGTERLSISPITTKYSIIVPVRYDVPYKQAAYSTKPPYPVSQDTELYEAIRDAYELHTAKGKQPPVSTEVSTGTFVIGKKSHKVLHISLEVDEKKDIKDQIHEFLPVLLRNIEKHIR